MNILKELAEEIRPEQSKEVSLRSDSKEVLAMLNKKVKDAKAVLGGSAAKGTRLKGMYDIDIFVCFNYKKYVAKNQELSNILEKALKKSFKGIKRIHGSRDYFHIKKNGVIFEIVPILDIKNVSQAKNIMDVSPHHVKWVAKNLKKNDEVRLLKAFCMSHDVYGAESYIRGFSGYACEVLIVNYGSFMNLIRAASKWSDKEILDVKKYYKRKNALDHINKSKTHGPLVLIDPVQASRNVTAALEKKKFDRFVKAAKMFLKKPSKSFFVKKEVTIDGLKKTFKNKKLIILKAKPVVGKTDVSGAKLLKTLEFLNTQLEENDFKVYSYDWTWDKDALFWFVVDKKNLEKTKIIAGPPVFREEHVQRFKKKHKKIFIKNKKAYAKISRKFTDASSLIKKAKSSPYLKGKVKSIEVLK
ncbi:MAG: CCA tRNA nucleotidyltransferase [bacterium]|nr:CCA tRNA nucleotidyltransferase [bacterium]